MAYIGTQIGILKFLLSFLKIDQIKGGTCSPSSPAAAPSFSFPESLKAIFWENKRKFCWIGGKLMPEMHYPNKQLTLLLPGEEIKSAIIIIKL